MRSYEDRAKGFIPANDSISFWINWESPLKSIVNTSGERMQWIIDNDLCILGQKDRFQLVLDECIYLAGRVDDLNEIRDIFKKYWVYRQYVR